MTGTVIRIRPEHLLRALALLLAVAAIPLGIVHTPYLHGRATLLTPERRDLMRYLDRAAGWAGGLGREADTLQRILDEATRDPGAGRLLDLGQTGTQALERWRAWRSRPTPPKCRRPRARCTGTCATPWPWNCRRRRTSWPAWARRARRRWPWRNRTWPTRAVAWGRFRT